MRHSTASRSRRPASTPGARAYLERKKAEGKSGREALRCLRRLLVRVVYQTLKPGPALTYEQHWRSGACARQKTAVLS
jgi:hypothetical protein